MAEEKQLFPLHREFIPEDKGEGDGLFYFHEPGDYLKGILYGTLIRETLHYKFKTYRMKVYEGRQDGVDLIIDGEQMIEFPANVKIRRLVDDHELQGSLVKIVYKGKKGRYKKYEVWKDTGTFYAREEQKYGKIKRKRKSRAKRAGVTAPAGAGRSEAAGAGKK